MRSIQQPLAGRRLALLTVLLGGFTAFGPLSMDLYLPAFPQLADDLGASQAAVQLTLTADVIGIVVGQLVLGPMSDAWGRRRLLIGSTLVCAVASVLCALAPSAAWLTVWRFLQGASGGGGIVLARAIAADIASGVAAARLFSLFMTLSSVAPIAAPVLGGVMLAATGSWRPMFWLLAAISLVLAAATWRAIPETLPAERRHAGGLRRTGRAFLELARDRVFAGYALTVAFAYASLFGYISGSSFALQDVYGLSATQFSLVFALNAAGMIVLGLLNARLVRRFPVRSLLLVGLVASTVAAVVLFVVVAGTGWACSQSCRRCSWWSPAAGWSRPTPPCSESSGHRPPVRPPPCSGRACSAAASWCPRCWPSAVRDQRSRWPRSSPAGPWPPWLATVVLTRGDHPEPAVDANAAVAAQPIEE